MARASAIAAATVAAALWLGAPGVRAEPPVDPSGGLPITIDAASRIDAGERELKLRFGFERTDGGRNAIVADPEVELSLARGLSVSVAPSYTFGSAEDADRGDVGFQLEYNLVEPRDGGFGLTIQPEITLPYGSGDEAAQFELMLLASRGLGTGKDAPRLHVNLAWRHLVDADPDERADRTFAAVGASLPVGGATALVLDLVREPARGRDEVDKLVEAGLRHSIAEGFVLAGGAGVGLGPDSPDFRLLLGLQRAF
ncbi:hypothetical protein [Arenibaculum pallidiluteum]|uniref:hypothetical protein n=1 Tax=Arenibaculum pallidiluteum TaxID=2812559 RepID=UPI001A975186|nr:hypothetical protein [Arenibaculum pallidiluteum]